MNIAVKGGEVPQAEIDVYIRRIQEKYPDRIIKELTLTMDGEFVDIRYTYDTIPFDRILRITGYLVGTLDRFNNAKRVEESQRIKHQI